MNNDITKTLYTYPQIKDKAIQEQKICQKFGIFKIRLFHFAIDVKKIGLTDILLSKIYLCRQHSMWLIIADTITT